MNGAEKDWDAIIIGTGIGGGTLGHALAAAGKRVLFCEKGRNYLDDAAAHRGEFAESVVQRQSSGDNRLADCYQRAGRWHDEIVDVSTGRVKQFIPFLGIGVGGSSALYGGAMERFFSADFTPGSVYDGSTGSNFPDAWPITYDELIPYYRQAESLYRVHGSPDPLKAGEKMSLSPPPPYSGAALELMETFRQKGLHPYRLPIACNYDTGCGGCQGFLCHSDCKNDSARICVAPAMEKHGAGLLTDCEVTRVLVENGTARGVFCRVDGKGITLRAKTIVLAAGALVSPIILMNSACPDGTDGLGNVSGLVGRNLMRHHIDLYAVFPRAKDGCASNDKELAFNDLYWDGGEKLGTFQSFGAMPPVQVVVDELQRDISRRAIPGLGWLFAPVKPMVRWGLGKVFSRAIIFAAIKEDLPYPENRVMPPTGETPAGPVRFKYTVNAHEKKRITIFREKIASILRPYRFMLIKQAENNERIAHACGTCRFGVDPETSVLDPFNRVHGVKNLYVTDASFFPTSGGTNPSLTIAANALRVADHMLNEADHI